jgi:type II secretory pathway pseudopilin PulG
MLLPNQRVKVGITLVELIVCIAIIAVLTGLIGTATIRSKDQAHRAANLQRLKQLGIATILYADTYGDYPTTKPAEALVDAGFVKDPNLFASRFDPTAEGVANETASNARSKYKVSDFHPFRPNRTALQFIRSRSSIYGLFADSTIGQRNTKGTTSSGLFFFIGPYQRVQSDSSVVFRTQMPVDYMPATVCLRTEFYLTDMIPIEQQQLCSGTAEPY